MSVSLPFFDRVSPDFLFTPDATAFRFAPFPDFGLVFTAFFIGAVPRAFDGLGIGFFDTAVRFAAFLAAGLTLSTPAFRPFLPLPLSMLRSPVTPVAFLTFDTSSPRLLQRTSHEFGIRSVI
jgi:hypothetical protein